MTQSEHSLAESEAAALVNDLESAARRQTIRAEHVALVAAATRAQRLLILIRGQAPTAD